MGRMARARLTASWAYGLRSSDEVWLLIRVVRRFGYTALQSGNCIARACFNMRDGVSPYRFDDRWERDNDSGARADREDRGECRVRKEVSAPDDGRCVTIRALSTKCVMTPYRTTSSLS